LFLTARKCEQALKQVSDRIALLPKNPEPWTTRLRQSHDDEMAAVLDELNAAFVGIGLTKVLDQEPS